MSVICHNSAAPSSGAELPKEGGDAGVYAFPASLAQQRFWFLDQMEPGNPAYNVAVRFRLLGALQAPLVERALNEIVQRHEVLRTTFETAEGLPLQLIAPSLNISVPVQDLRALPERERNAEVERLTVEDAAAPFDLRTGPLLRASLLQVDHDNHVLLITVHHIVADGWSIGIITNELGALYEAYSRGAATPLPDLPIQYADFSHWQRGALQDTALESLAAYWTPHLTGLPPLELPTDHARPPVQSYRGDILSILLPKTLTGALRDLSGREGSTLFMTCLAALNVLLRRYTSQDDIGIGSQIVGRNRVEVENLIGLFINTLVMRTDLSGDPTFRELLSRVRETVLRAFAHQDMPFEQLVEALRPRRDLSRHPLFQVNFIYQRDFIRPLHFAGITLTSIPSKSPGAMYDLNFFMVERDEGWRASCEFNPDLFDAATVERMLGHFQNLLEQVAANPERRISELSLLTRREQQKMLVEWNDTRAEYPDTLCVHQLFEAQVKRTPDAPAVAFGSRTLTYRELNARANQLARRLERLGVGTESLVGVCVERSEEMLVALLGILKAGAAYVPLDPSFPTARLTLTLENAGVQVLLAERRFLGLLQGHGSAISLEAERTAIERENPSDQDREVGPANSAYVIYTSGSTGTPKGVQIPHRAVVNLLASMQKQPGITSVDTLVAVTTVSFDIAALELFLPLITGARVVVASREEASDGQRLRNLLQRSGATVLQATPATWRMLLAAGWPGDPRLKLLCGGEALPRELANQLVERGCELWNLYGPTETTIWSSACRVTHGDGPVSIGPPIQNTQFYVLDRRSQPVPVGVPGELHIGGDGLARGYWKRPEQTADKFISNPFSVEPGSRLYRTGDLVRYLPTGSLEYLGRIDHQVKVRGFRIELGDVEAVLLEHPAVRQAVAVAVDDEAGGSKLAAYVVAETEGLSASEGLPNLVAELRSLLKQKLPDYMHPSVIVKLAAMPLTANGKIDRRSLPALDAVPSQESEEVVVPTDPLQIRLAKIWESVLGVQALNATSNFFDVGGHSLLAARLLDRVEQAFGKRLPLAALFHAPTLKEQADLLREGALEPRLPSMAPIQPYGSRTPFFCVDAGPFFRPLAQRLGTDQPFLGLVFPETGPHPASLTIEEIAAYHIETIRELSPKGPYILGGWCVAGIVAYEMAQQLVASGEQVAQLVLFDSINPAFRSRLSKFGAWSAELRYALVRLKRRLSWGQVRSWLKQPSGAANRKEGDEREQEMQRLFLDASKRYIPRPYSGPAVLFRSAHHALASEGMGPFRDPALGWKEFVNGSLRVSEVSGDHRGVFLEPHVGSLARELAASLDKAGAESVMTGDPGHSRVPEPVLTESGRKG